MICAQLQISLSLLLLVPTLLLFIFGLITGFGRWDYPVAFTFWQRIGTVPLWSAWLLFFSYGAVLLLFIILTAIKLNQLTHSFYVTLFILGISTVICTVLPKMPTPFYLTPLPYLNVNQVITGQLLIKTDLPIGWFSGVIVLALWSGLVFVLLLNRGRQDHA